MLTDVLVADGSEPHDKIAPAYFFHFYIMCELFLRATLQRIILFFSDGCYKPLILINGITVLLVSIKLNLQ